jgi:hypothetical protein
VKVTATFPFDATREALARLGQGHLRGKIVIAVADV